MNIPFESSRGSFDPYKSIKCVIVGDTCVGKTRLICSYVYDEKGRTVSSLCHKHHIPTVFAIDQYSLDANIRCRAKVSVNGFQSQLHIWDTFGDHSKNRKYAYQTADVVVICFNIGLESSLRNVNAKWYPEIKKYCPRAPIILVGTQHDRRHIDVNCYKTCQVTTLTDILKNNLNQTVKRNSVSNGFKCISPETGRQTSREISAVAYLEASIVTKHGVNDVFESAIYAAFIAGRGSRPLFNSYSKCLVKPLIQKPFLPEKVAAPEVIVPENMFSIDFYSYFGDNINSDVTFLVEQELIIAHSLVLLTGSPVFYSLFTHPGVLVALNYNVVSKEKYQLKLEQAKVNGVMEYGIPQGFESIDLLADPGERCKVFVKVANVPANDFKSILEFLYKGEISNVENITQLLHSASYLQVDVVFQYASALLEDDITQVVNARNELKVYRSHIIGHTLCKSNFFADVTFLVDEIIIPVHKLVLMAGCPMMAGMFRNSSFREGVTQNVDFKDTNVESFLAVLEYLYTGNCEYFGDLHGTLQLANFLCLPRLVALCEREIVQYILDLQETNASEAFEAVLASYNVARIHNAPQLTDWCLHFIATNYNSFCKEQGKCLKLLDEKTQKYLEEHRWPPVWYLKEQDYYERAMQQLEREKLMKKNLKAQKKCRSCCIKIH